jgi:hypothetical protein
VALFAAEIRMLFSRRFCENVSLYVSNGTSVEGSVSVLRAHFGPFGYFRATDCSLPFPFDSILELNPLCDPYRSSNGHYIFSLSYYSELTVIEDPPRLCFHDSMQELGISLNFVSEAAFSEYFSLVEEEITLVTRIMSLRVLPAFFIVQRFNRALLRTDQRSTIDAAKSELLAQGPTNNDDLFSSHSDLICRFNALCESTSQTKGKMMPLATADQLSNALSSPESLNGLLKHFSIPDDQKAEVWLFQLGFTTPGQVPDAIRSWYSDIKGSWCHVTESQYRRSQLTSSSFRACSDYIEGYRTFFQEIVGDPTIISIAFNVFMNIIQVYHCFVDHLDLLRTPFGVLLRIFVDKTRTANGDTVFIGRKGQQYDRETLEIMLFWSLLFLLEAGESRLLVDEKDGTHQIAEEVNSFIFLVHPQLFKCLFDAGVRDYDDLGPLLMTFFASELKWNQCADIWLAAMASPNIMTFIQYLLIASLFFNFPNIFSLEKAENRSLLPVVKQAFEFVDHRYLEVFSFVLSEHRHELIAVQ